MFAVDLPTGLDGDSGKTDRDCVIADFTVTIGFAKPGLLADDALNFVGRLEVVQLDELRAPEKKAKEVVAARQLFVNCCRGANSARTRISVDALVLLPVPRDSSAQH